MNIYFVIFIARLKFLFVNNDLYERLRFDDDYSFLIITKNYHDLTFYCKIKCLVKK